MNDLFTNKKSKITDTELYKALKWFDENEKLSIEKSKHIRWCFILYVIEHITYKKENGEIRIYKNK